MRCRTVRRLLGDYVEGVLDEGRVVVVARHLERCEGCAQEFALERLFVERLAEQPAPEVPLGFAEEVVERFYAEAPERARGLGLVEMESWNWLIALSTAGRVFTPSWLTAAGGVMHGIATHALGNLGHGMASGKERIQAALFDTLYTILYPVEDAGRKLNAGLRTSLVPSEAGG